MTFRINIDGEVVTAEAAEFLLDVLQRHGAEVPSLCHHRHLAPAGACRVCLVEVTDGGQTRLTTSCNYRICGDMEVRTRTEEVLRNRRKVLSLLLAMAPDAVLIQGMARAAGVSVPAPLVPRSPGGLVNCILCGRCTRVCADVVGACAIAMSGRGSARAVRVPFDEPIADSCIGCGACSAVCPTDAISMEDRKVEVLRRLPASRRPCRYSLMGMTSGALCPNDYNCAVCEVDQEYTAACAPHHPVFVARGLVPINGTWEKGGRR